MNRLQPQDSLRKLKKFKNGKKLKKNEARMGTQLLPQPPTPNPNRPWEAKHSAPTIQKLLRSPCPLEVVPCAKIFGLTVSSSLKWNDHIYQTIMEARKRLYFLTQLKRAKVATDKLVLFYTTCIRPILEFECPVFHDSLLKYLSKDLESIQKRALRVIHPWTPYSDVLLLTGLQSLSTRRDNITNKLFQNIVMDKNHKLHKFIPPRNTCVTELRTKHNFNTNVQTDRFKNSFFMANSLKF